MSDMDAISNARDRVAVFESELDRIRGGRKPVPLVDLLAWTAGTLPVAAQGNAGTSTRLLDIVWQTLREDWRGLHEAVAAGAARIDERFPR